MAKTYDPIKTTEYAGLLKNIKERITIVKTLPDEMKNLLPTPEQIEKTLAEI